MKQDRFKNSENCKVADLGEQVIASPKVIKQSITM
jgi:hypothetical protein